MNTVNVAKENLKSVLYDAAGREFFRSAPKFKNAIGGWNRGFYNSHYKVGKLMLEIKALPGDAPLQAWEDFYTTNVRTWDRIEEQVVLFAQNEGYTFKDAANIWWSYIIDSVWSGWKNENLIMEMLETHVALLGLAVRGASDVEDREEGADAVIYDPNTLEVISGIQTKPIKYKLSTRPTVVHARTVVNPKKYEKFAATHNGAPMFYVFIEPSLKTGKLELIPSELVNSR